MNGVDDCGPSHECYHICDLAATRGIRGSRIGLANALQQIDTPFDAVRDATGSHAASPRVFKKPIDVADDIHDYYLYRQSRYQVHAQLGSSRRLERRRVDGHAATDLFWLYGSTAQLYLL